MNMSSSLLKWQMGFDFFGLFLLHKNHFYILQIFFDSLITDAGAWNIQPMKWQLDGEKKMWI